MVGDHCSLFPSILPELVICNLIMGAMPPYFRSEYMFAYFCLFVFIQFKMVACNKGFLSQMSTNGCFIPQEEINGSFVFLLRFCFIVLNEKTMILCFLVHFHFSNTFSIHDPSRSPQTKTSHNIEKQRQHVSMVDKHLSLSYD